MLPALGITQMPRRGHNSAVLGLVMPTTVSIILLSNPLLKFNSDVSELLTDMF